MIRRACIDALILPLADECVGGWPKHLIGRCTRRNQMGPYMVCMVCPNRTQVCDALDAGRICSRAHPQSLQRHTSSEDKIKATSDHLADNMANVQLRRE